MNPVTHEQARQSVDRFVNNFFHNEGSLPVASIPANEERDDDLLLCRYIEEQRKNDTALRSALTIAAATFRLYEKLHLAKEPADDVKAKKNAQLAEMCEAVINHK